LSKPVDIGSVKVGTTILIGEEPCRIVEYEKSKPGKHGAMKARIVAIGIFDGAKRSIISPVDGKADIPIIDKRSGQLVSVSGSTVQIMDLETYEVFELPAPDDPELKPRLVPPSEVEYWRVMGRSKIVRVKG